MNPQLFAAFLLITLVLVVTPGPIVTLVVATGATRGVRPALATVVGTTLGNALLLTAIALGLSWVLANALILFEVMRWAGAAYLVYLGVQAWRGAAKAATAPPVADHVHFVRGLSVALTNPEDDRLLHRLPAAVRRPVAAGGAPARRDVRGVDADGGDDRHRLGRRGRPRPRLVHAPVARQVARPALGKRADRRRRLAVAGETAGVKRGGAPEQAESGFAHCLLGEAAR